VQGFTRVQINRRRSGAGKGRGDLMADDAGLTNARNNNFPLAGKDEINRLLELIRKPEPEWGYVVKIKIGTTKTGAAE